MDHVTLSNRWGNPFFNRAPGFKKKHLAISFFRNLALQGEKLWTELLLAVLVFSLQRVFFFNAREHSNMQPFAWSEVVYIVHSASLQANTEKFPTT